MAFSVPFASQAHAQPVVEYSRLIPGVRHSPGKESRSVKLDAGVWTGGIQEKASVDTIQGFLRAAVELVLPRPGTMASQWHLWRFVIHDFVLVVLSFMVATHLRPLLTLVVHSSRREMMRTWAELASGDHLSFA